MNTYVYHHPIGTWKTSNDCSAQTTEIYGTDYLLGFLNEVCMMSLEYIDRLTDLNVISVNDIISTVIDSYLPLNYIIQYNPDEYKNKKLMII